MQIPSSGLRAADLMLGVAADNVANAQTPGYRPGRVELADAGPGRGVAVTGVSRSPVEPPEGFSGSDLADDIPQTIIASAMYSANASVLRTYADTTATLLSIKA